jgi:hypothetical protein
MEAPVSWTRWPDGWFGLAGTSTGAFWCFGCRNNRAVNSVVAMHTKERHEMTQNSLLSDDARDMVLISRQFKIKLRHTARLIVTIDMKAVPCEQNKKSSLKHWPGFQLGLEDSSLLPVPLYLECQTASGV